MPNSLVTGCAGFIGSVVTGRWLHSGHTVIGVGNLNDHYNVRLKEKWLERQVGFRFARDDIETEKTLRDVFVRFGPFDAVLNLSART